MPDSFDVVIVGAGIVGAACALECVTAGLSVGVIERDVVGSGATAAGMGHIVVMDDSPAQLALTRYSRQLWDALVLDMPERHEYTRCGTIWVAADDEEMQAVHDKHRAYAAQDVPAAVLDARALRALEPRLRPGLAGGLLVPGDSVVYAPGSASVLLERARQRGAALVHGTATRLLPGGVRLSDASVVAGDAVVIATGAAAIDLVPEVPIRPRKGHLAITDRYPGVLRHQLVELGYVKSAHATSGDSVAFNVQPRATGQLLIGSSRQLDTRSTEIDFSLLARMVARALEYLPHLCQLSCIRVWTGLRAATADGLPLIGPHPERAGVWLATGHEGLGITGAPATARLLAAQLLNRRPAIPHEPY
ncbi:MAG TPA: FAD-dependent oxidoreductase, partial [Chloroflexota bacterium]|nr:FAD-dependent oxidoreductase [Chloroflexota bacterium]